MLLHACLRKQRNLQETGPPCYTPPLRDKMRDMRLAGPSQALWPAYERACVHQDPTRMHTLLRPNSPPPSRSPRLAGSLSRHTACIRCHSGAQQRRSWRRPCSFATASSGVSGLGCRLLPTYWSPFLANAGPIYHRAPDCQQASYRQQRAPCHDACLCRLMYLPPPQQHTRTTAC